MVTNEKLLLVMLAQFRQLRMLTNVRFTQLQREIQMDAKTEQTMLQGILDELDSAATEMQDDFAALRQKLADQGATTPEVDTLLNSLQARADAMKALADTNNDAAQSGTSTGTVGGTVASGDTSAQSTNPVQGSTTGTASGEIQS